MTTANIAAINRVFHIDSTIDKPIVMVVHALGP